MLKTARRLFDSGYVSTAVNRANRLKWVRSIRALGDKWVFATRVEKKS